MNALSSVLHESLVQRMGWVLIHFLWQGAIIAGFLAVLLKSLSKAHFRYLALCGALFGCGLAPVITWLALVDKPVGTALLSKPDGSAVRLTVTEIPANEAGSGTSPTRAGLPPSASKIIQTNWAGKVLPAMNVFLPYAVIFWLAGVLILTLRLMLGWMHLRRIRLSGRAIQDPDWLNRFQRLMEQMGIRRAVQLLESAMVEVPTLVGWLRPVILLPAAIFVGLTPGQLEAILAHELAHVRRRDYLVNLLQTVIETILFYHPVIWWIGRKLREERENCCDDIALGISQDRVAYASALATLEAGRAASSPLMLAAAGGSLLQRIRRIAGVDAGKSSMVPLIITVLIIGFLAGPLAGQVASPTPAKESQAEPKIQGSRANGRFTDLINDHCFDHWKVSDLPLPELIEKLKDIILAHDLCKEGINFDLHIPEGEEPIRITDDVFANATPSLYMIFDALKRRYPIKYKLNDHSISVWQLPKQEIEFEQKAAGTKIDVDFAGIDAVSALKKVQSESALKGFPFILDLDALKAPQPIVLHVVQAGVDQVLRAIFYLGDLRTTPLDNFKGYRVEQGSAKETKARTFFKYTFREVSLKIDSTTSDEIKRLNEAFQKSSVLSGLSMEGRNVPWGGEFTYPVNLPGRSRPAYLAFKYKSTIVDKTQIKTDGSLQLETSDDSFSSKMEGTWTKASGARLSLISSENWAFDLPAKESDPAQGVMVFVQATLVDEESQPLLPPPGEVEEVRLSKIKTGLRDPVIETEFQMISVPNSAVGKLFLAASEQDIYQAALNLIDRDEASIFDISKVAAPNGRHTYAVGRSRVDIEPVLSPDHQSMDMNASIESSKSKLLLGGVHPSGTMNCLGSFDDPRDEYDATVFVFAKWRIVEL